MSNNYDETITEPDEDSKPNSGVRCNIAEYQLD